MKHDEKQANGRTALRLIKGGEPDAPKPADAPKPSSPKSALVAFMNAYADSIDNDIRMILEL